MITQIIFENIGKVCGVICTQSQLTLCINRFSVPRRAEYNIQSSWPNALCGAPA